MSVKERVAWCCGLALAMLGCSQAGPFPVKGLPRSIKLQAGDLSVCRLSLRDNGQTLLKLHPEYPSGELSASGLIRVKWEKGKLASIYGYTLEVRGREIARHHDPVARLETLLGSPDRVSQEDKSPDRLESWHYGDLGLAVGVSKEGILDGGFYWEPVKQP